jgi:hypothetical protein
MARPPANGDLKFPDLEWRCLTTAEVQASWLIHAVTCSIANRKSEIGNRKLIDSLALCGLPVHFAASPAAQFTHLPSSETRIGSSSIMNWVFPMAPIIRTPVAAYHFFDISSPVWQPQLLT